VNDLQIPGVGPYGDHGQRVTGSRNKPDREGGRSRFERESDAETGDGQHPPAPEERPAAPRPPDEGPAAPDEGDGTGQRINVTV